MLAPLETQVFIGNQISRAKSEGIEFADIREWAPGDRVRSINWRATARRGELHVNQQHPERNTDVVLFLDTFTDVAPAARGTLDMTVRAATSLAHKYLERKDRVGVVSFGGYLSWLLPASGTRQLYRIVDSLLQMDIVLSFARKGIDILPPRTLPPKALVLALSPLLDVRSAARAARPARARLRSRRDRGVAGAVRARRGATSSRSSRTACGACRASRCACVTSRPASPSSSGSTASRSMPCWRR